MSALIWIHEDALRDDHPVMDAAPDGARRVFVWDADDFQARGYSLKRLVFIHECLQDMDVELFQGDTHDVLEALSGGAIFTPETLDPARQSIIQRLRDHRDVTVVAEAPLTRVPEDTDMGRFFRFWNRARKSAMSLTSEIRAAD